MEENENRKEKRKDVHVVAELVIGDRTTHAVCNNISESGCRIRLDFYINMKTFVILKLYGIGEDKQMTIYDPINGYVRWTRQSKADPKVFFSGVEFSTTLNENHGVGHILRQEDQSPEEE